MNDPASQPDELDGLLWQLADGTLDDASWRRLADLLKSDASAMDRYIGFMSLHGMLKQSLGPGVPWQATVPSQLPGARRRIFDPAALRVAAAAVIVIAVMLGAMSMFEWRGAPDSAVAMPEMAVLEEAIEPVWAGGGESPRVGAVVSRSFLHLRSGLIRVRFSDGSAAVVQGPAEFQVNPTGGGLLHAGRMVYHAALRGRPSSVTAAGLLIAPEPRAVVGLRVTGVGRREVHVITGRVDVKVDEGDNRQSSHSLSAAQGLGVDSGQPAKLMAADLDSFARLGAVDAAAKAHRAEVYDQWHAYTDELRRDKDLVTFFRFDHPTTMRDTLPNAAGETSGAGGAGGQIAGARWVEGRWPQKAALEFTKRDDRVAFDIPQTGHRYTMAARVKPYGLSHTVNVLVHTSMWRTPGQPHWAIRADGRMHLAVHKDVIVEPATGDPQCAVTDYSILSDLGRWVHLAVAHDAAAKTTRLYVNGRLDHTWTYTTAHPPAMGPAFLGNWDRDKWNLIGCVDELAIFRRALTTEEVRRMYEAGNPYR